MNKNKTKTTEANEQNLDEGQLEQVSGGQKPLSDVGLTDMPDGSSNDVAIAGIPGHIA